MSFLSSFYPQPVVAGTTEGTFAEGDDARITGAIQASALSSGSVTATGSSTARTLANRFADVVNVRDFGAVGNGSTNDYAAIQAAITAAPSGGTVYFPRGIYHLATQPSVVVGKNLTFIGDGESSVITLEKTTEYGFRLSSGCSFASFRDLTFSYNQGYFDSTGSTQNLGNHVAIWINGVSTNSEIYVNNCKFFNIMNAMWNWTLFKKIEVTNSSFIFQYGNAGLRLFASSQHPCVSVLVGAETTIVQRCYFDGLVDDTFSGVLGDPPDKWKTPADGIYFNGGTSPLFQEVSDCTVLNHGIEGIFVNGMGTNGAYFTNVANNKSVTSLVSVNSGNASFPKEVTATVSNHGYKVGDTVLISGVTGVNDQNYNGNHVIQSVETNTFKYLTKTVSSATASGTIISNVTIASRRRMSIVKNNTIRASMYKSEYYSGTQPSIVANEGAGELVEVSGNTISGSPAAITTGPETFPKPNGVEPQTLLITNNTIYDSIIGIQIWSRNGTIITKNKIHVSSAWGKQQTTWEKNTNAYCFLVPIQLIGTSAIVTDNFIIHETPLWDAELTVTSRSNVTPTFTVTNGTLISNNLRPLDQNDQQDYGVLVAYTDNRVNVYPITGINGNDIAVDSDYFNNQTAFSTGTAYWAKTSGDQWPRQAAINILSASGKTSQIYNNTVIKGQWDILPDGTVDAAGNTFVNPRAYWTSGINRLGNELRDGVLRFGGVSFLQGAVEPSASAPNGSIFLRTNGDASTTLYVRASNAWKPLSSWNP